MANLKLKKTDLKGPLSVGGGWLVAVGWAVRTNGDRRLINVDTVEAAFAGLDVGAIEADMVVALEDKMEAAAVMAGYAKTRVLFEGEDGALTRVYRGPGTHCCLTEDYLRVLGHPRLVARVGDMYVCNTGIIAPTTDECPDWAWEVLV